MEDPIRPPADPGFRLIETCRWTPGEGIALRARHLARLARSAARLGITPHGAEAALARVVGPGPLRVRLTCDAQGHVTVEMQPFTPLPDGAVWRYGMAPERLCSGDPWRGMKTTERGIYDRARAAMPDGCDELLFLNEHGALCEGTITNLFVDLGDGLLTPPLSCGVLPGVLREDLIAQGVARERVLRPADLAAARSVWLGNALRGLVRAQPA